MASNDNNNRPFDFHFVLDGQQVGAREGWTILDAAKAAGLGDRIPTLCHLEGLRPYTSCFVCVVQQQGRDKLIPACSTPAAPGLDLVTGSPAVVEARRAALELLLSDHPADCMAPCTFGCPAGIDVQEYIALVKAGKFVEAVKEIRKRNPLPVVCGRVCVRFCEKECRRSLVDEPVAINAIKRAASEHWVTAPYEPEGRAEPSGKSVAVVGGGPAGLSAAWFLMLAGHRVCIYEAREKAGGMLRWGIPDYRLPQELLDFEIGEIVRQGVELRCGVKVGREVSLEELTASHDAVFLSVGAQKGSPAMIEGEDGPGVLRGVDFLGAVKLGRKLGLEGATVLVVGGGNTAVDAARTAVRLGAGHVTMLYRRTRAEMPADPAEIDAAEAEGVRLELLVAPVEVLREGEALKGLVLRKMQLGEPGPDGRRKPVPVAGSEHTIKAGVIITAVGQQADLAGLTGGVDLERWGTVKVDPKNLASSHPKVFAGGDAVLGPSTVIESIAQGRRAALALELFLRTGERRYPKVDFAQKREPFGPLKADEYPLARPGKRLELESIPLARRHSFDEVELTPAEPETQVETERCLACGCLSRHDCTLRELAQAHGIDQTVVGSSRILKKDFSHPHLAFDPNKCVRCTRCIRTCGELLGVHVFGLVDRGFDSQVAPSVGRPLGSTTCIDCGNCVDACPTGALTFKNLAQQRPSSSALPAVCGLCGEACETELHEGPFGWSVKPAWAPEGPALLCGLGRFGAQEAAQRPVASFRRSGGQRVVLDDAEAIKEALDGMGRLAKTHGSGSLLFCVGADCSAEDSAAVQALAQSFGARCHSLAALLGTRSALGVRTPMAELAKLDGAAALFILGDALAQARPPLRARVRRLQARGVVPVLLGARAPSWLSEGVLELPATPETLTAVLEAARAGVCETQGPVLALFAAQGPGAWGRGAILALDAFLAGLGREAALIPYHPRGSGAALAALGLTAGLDQLRLDLRAGAIKGLWLYGERWPAALAGRLPRPEFVVQQGHLEGNSGDGLDLHLDGSWRLEAGGTWPQAGGAWFASPGRVGRESPLRAVLEAAGLSWGVLRHPEAPAELCLQLGTDGDFADLDFRDLAGLDSSLSGPKEPLP